VSPGCPVRLRQHVPMRISKFCSSTVLLMRLRAASVIKGFAFPVSQRVTFSVGHLVRNRCPLMLWPGTRCWVAHVQTISSFQPSHSVLQRLPSTRAGRCDPDCPIRKCASFASCTYPCLSHRKHTVTDYLTSSDIVGVFRQHHSSLHSALLRRPNNLDCVFFIAT
jgi:hypothetical protein